MGPVERRAPHCFKLKDKSGPCCRRPPSGIGSSSNPGFWLLMPVPLRGPLPEDSPDSNVRVRRWQFCAPTDLPKANEWLVFFGRRNLRRQNLVAQSGLAWSLAGRSPPIRTTATAGHRCSPAGRDAPSESNSRSGIFRPRRLWVFLPHSPAEPR